MLSLHGSARGRPRLEVGCPPGSPARPAQRIEVADISSGSAYIVQSIFGEMLDILYFVRRQLSLLLDAQFGRCHRQRTANARGEQDDAP